MIGNAEMTDSLYTACAFVPAGDGRGLCTIIIARYFGTTDTQAEIVDYFFVNGSSVTSVKVRDPAGL